MTAFCDYVQDGEICANKMICVYHQADVNAVLNPTDDEKTLEEKRQLLDKAFDAIINLQTDLSRVESILESKFKLWLLERMERRGFRELQPISRLMLLWKSATYEQLEILPTEKLKRIYGHISTFDANSGTTAEELKEYFESSMTEEQVDGNLTVLIRGGFIVELDRAEEDPVRRFKALA